MTVWTSRRRAAALASRGTDVVVASAPLYFDAAQGDPAQEPPATRYMATLREVFDAGVAPRALGSSAREHVLGAEACVWTEHIATAGALFRMTFPRALALAEIAWAPRDAVRPLGASARWDDFLARLPPQLDRLAARGVAFRIPNVTFAFAGGRARFDAVPGHVQSVTVRTPAPALTLSLSVPLDAATLRYTTDGSAPTAASRRYARPFVVHAESRPLRVRTAAWYHGMRGSITEAIVVRVRSRTFGPGTPGSHSWASLVSP